MSRADAERRGSLPPAPRPAGNARLSIDRRHPPSCRLRSSAVPTTACHAGRLGLRGSASPCHTLPVSMRRSCPVANGARCHQGDAGPSHVARSQGPKAMLNDPIGTSCVSSPRRIWRGSRQRQPARPGRTSRSNSDPPAIATVTLASSMAGCNGTAPPQLSQEGVRRSAKGDSAIRKPTEPSRYVKLRCYRPSPTTTG